MLLVNTKIGPSKIHGIGLFADEYIPKGKMIWRFDNDIDRQFTEEVILKLPMIAQRYLTKYAWKGLKTGIYCLSTDNAKHFNHSKECNTRLEYIKNEPEGVVYATRDIEIGEELTEDYDDFENINDPYNVLVNLLVSLNLVDEMDPRLKPIEKVNA